MASSRRTIKRALVWLAATIGVIILVLGGLVAYAAHERQDTFALRDAEFADVAYLQRIALESDPDSRGGNGNFSVYAHRLKHGSGTVFGLRAYSPGSLAVVDDETYRKITVWIAGSLPAGTVEVPLTDQSQARVVVTDGGSAWPRSACSRIATAGFVRVERGRAGFTVHVHADTVPAGKVPLHDCAAESVDVQFRAKEIAFEHLTPWLGLAGRHPYDETYR